VVLEAARELPGLAPVAVADRDRGRADALAAAHRLDACGPERLLADPRVAVVAVATPPASHAELALAALRGGRHVFCEKPLATRLEDATEVLAAAGAPGAPRLTVDYVLRRNPLYALVRRLQQALLGPPRRFALENLAADEHLAPDHWFWDRAASGGIAVEHGVHFFDAAAWLLGSQPERVQALESSPPPRPGGPPARRPGSTPSWPPPATPAAPPPATPTASPGPSGPSPSGPPWTGASWPTAGCTAGSRSSWSWTSAPTAPA
jgi:predicted dehydrogenase